MYSVIQFAEKDGGTVSVINNRWFTPRRCEVFWPPAKGTKAFENFLAEDKSPDEKWKFYSIARVFCETDDIEKAKKKLKLVEDTSDIGTDAEGDQNLKRKRTKKYVSSSDDDDKHIRPPTLKKKTIQKLSHAAGNVCLDTYQAQQRNIQETPSIPQKAPLNIVDGLPVLTNSILRDLGSQLSDSALAEDGDYGEGRLTPVARLGSPRCRKEQTPNLAGDVQATLHTKELTGYQAKVLSMLTHIKTQNEILIEYMKQSTNTSKASLNKDFKFPLKSKEDINNLEIKLLESNEHFDNLVSFLRTLGGKDISSKVSRIMKVCLSDEIAEKYNFYGKRSNKKPFCQLRLRECVVEGVVTTTSEATVKQVEDSIKIWLKHAPEGLKKSQKEK